MSSSGARAAAWLKGRSDRRNPLAIIIGLVLIAGILILALPPIVRFAAFLFAGGVWRDLLGVALISLLVGLVLAVVVGSFDRSAGADGPGTAREDRSRGPLWALSGILIALVPAACILVALVASGALVDLIEWVGDRVAEIRGAQSS